MHDQSKSAESRIRTYATVFQRKYGSCEKGIEPSIEVCHRFCIIKTLAVSNTPRLNEEQCTGITGDRNVIVSRGCGQMRQLRELILISGIMGCAVRGVVLKRTGRHPNIVFRYSVSHGGRRAIGVQTARSG